MSACAAAVEKLQRLRHLWAILLYMARLSGLSTVFPFSACSRCPLKSRYRQRVVTLRMTLFRSASSSLCNDTSDVSLLTESGAISAARVFLSKCLLISI